MTITPREAAVRDLICSGLTSKEAATELSISPRTVDVYRGRLLDKYGARNTAELVSMVRLAERNEAVSSENVEG